MLHCLLQLTHFQLSLLLSFQADIGLSMGIQGTEVAKESSDIIILDDNFSSVVKVSKTFRILQSSSALNRTYVLKCLLSLIFQVVRWGRSVYANIQKFIQFQLTVNVAALVINVVAAISSGNVPLNAVQVCSDFKQLWHTLLRITVLPFKVFCVS
jgi:P-type Ca2+ transporter type 2C